MIFQLSNLSNMVLRACTTSVSYVAHIVLLNLERYSDKRSVTIALAISSMLLSNCDLLCK